MNDKPMNDKPMNDKPMTGFGMAPIVMEGGIADPDAFTWECNCEDCKDNYAKWKAEFDIQQKQLGGEA